MADNLAILFCTIALVATIYRVTKLQQEDKQKQREKKP